MPCPFRKRRQPLGVFGLLDFFSLPFIVSFALLGLVLWKMGTEGSRYVRGGPRSSGAFSLGRIWRKVPCCSALHCTALVPVTCTCTVLLCTMPYYIATHHNHYTML